MLKAGFRKYTLIFKRPSGTSRGVLTEKDSYFLFIYEADNPEKVGVGECGLLKGLSFDNINNYETVLEALCKNINNHEHWYNNELEKYPSIQFGLEMALLDLKQGANRVLFPSDFTKGEDSIDINGLIWMGTKEYMNQQIKEKIEQGFNCLKLKIGSLNFEDEIELLKNMRKQFDENSIQLRLDANGAFLADEAMEKLKRLSEYKIHSIEQPIKPQQWNVMSLLCKNTPIPIALDEELIGIFEQDKKKQMLDEINPQYIILKPSLLGGFKKSEEWISFANERNIKWWVTSALESNIGLNAIAQWTYSLKKYIHHGLGTGLIYKNNISLSINIKRGKLFHDANKALDLKFLLG